MQGQVIGTGASNIDNNANNIVTLKCTSCGAEVVIDTSTTTSARCHWCRNTLSINEKVPNGAISDIVLPFYIKKKMRRQVLEDLLIVEVFLLIQNLKKNLPQIILWVYIFHI